MDNNVPQVRMVKMLYRDISLSLSGQCKYDHVLLMKPKSRTVSDTIVLNDISTK